jgi:hypothetical protein
MNKSDLINHLVEARGIERDAARRVIGELEVLGWGPIAGKLPEGPDGVQVISTSSASGGGGSGRGPVAGVKGPATYAVGQGGTYASAGQGPVERDVTSHLHMNVPESWKTWSVCLDLPTGGFVRATYDQVRGLHVELKGGDSGER